MATATDLTRRPLDGTAIGLMVVLCMCWGLQQVAIKVAVHDVGPVMQAGVRSAIASVLVLAFALWRGTSLTLRDGTLPGGLMAGVLFGIEFLCIFIGLGHTTASRMAVFLYTAPIFTALGLHVFVPGEHLRLRQWAGIGIAFAGMVLAFADGMLHPAAGPSTSLGDALGVLAGVLWSATTLVVRASRLSEAPAAKTLLYQLAVSAVLLLAMAAGTGQTWTTDLTPTALASLAYQSVLIAFASYLTWFWLLRRYLASRLSVFSFLTPLFGVAFGVLLHDPVGLRFALAAALVLSGILLVNLR
ncbi:DMT family transporter [Ralstonia syzygii subsp. celebesensis]|uniref:EamA family transporter n=2 Tax=Ralstonia syzygii subsp. celebesensis TaxID=1310168 RepID=A0A1U9VIV3_9RALS|nr:DMT family transporter [Ralstonia syzygii]AQW30610.1 EamA family transporter [blood disease bacterium A2-HR MARDI]QQV55566.1 DMT family transporter [Ralstonia syzygii subsp. celebesensis]CCA81216.1 putative membrane lipoprotein [blood disease bacterium R229]